MPEPFALLLPEQDDERQSHHRDHHTKHQSLRRRSQPRPVAEALNNLEAVLQATMRVDAGEVRFITTTGQTGTLDDVLDLHTAATPRSSTAPPSATGNATERAMAKMRAERATLNRETAAAIFAEAGNPWIAGPGFSRTNQAVLTNQDPALASRLQREAKAQ